MPVYLTGLATAVPPYELTQNLVLEYARRILGPKFAQFERMSGTFLNAGVEKRYSLAPLEWFLEPQNWRTRNEVYLRGGTELFIDAARRALLKAGLRAQDIDTIVTVSSTGIATPTLEAQAWSQMGFRQDILRVPVFGLGCAGGVSGMAIARELAQAKPGTNVLLVALEACTLSFRSDRLTKADIIATVLFGDGAAAACLSTNMPEDTRKTIELGSGQQEIWPDTLNIMGWNVDESGLGVVFDRSIPDFARDHFKDVTDRRLSAQGLSMQDLTRFVCHPGGAKVVQALEQALDLPSNSLDAEREVLRDYGNMSAPTALFVLERVLEQPKPGLMMMCALGPGFTASFLPITVVAQPSSSASLATDHTEPTGVINA
ncbi:3-oxoacyl-[acyl-carrier-protein] synthase III C-terminal domain-containing protein [Pseudovibrio sp. Tun.PSC04-5.I4]|uniref:type III polyketide synthase n=1 Tax=Pseudovibrio sp. Tun.PSC04-5.I4 TaxID=1798213 RepID=UPI00088CA26B|nr:3-oxoacyl-[acyl-carrier-protein] synthase III C-terminal domain-containing protein [Pseudovibrio sp. Tun.PSC04-5.I4]SDQ11899.1 alkylresorcinol/alkylpyrone synthase [Pseudovibrio sp. Tun.PSC04-5.I4]SDQ24865.1 (2-(2,4-dihydroxy-6-methylphenyl)-2-oxoethyl)-4-hydroxy-2-pyrone synthase [Pseudovibrio sp. Tun.PSC04-5.I4]